MPGCKVCYQRLLERSMTEKRRKKLREADGHLNEAFNMINTVFVEEDMKMRNVPYNLQNSDDYADREEALEHIEEALDYLKDARSELQEIIG